MDDITVIIISFGATSAVWVTIFELFGKGYLEKLNRDWKTKQENDIVELKSALQIYKSSTDEIQKKRIAAVDELWNSVLELGNLIEPLSIIEAFSKSESLNSAEKEARQNWIKNLPQYDPYAEIVQRHNYNDRKLRPFLTNEVWKYYHVYRGFIFRTMFDAIIAIQNNQEIPNWKENPNITPLLKLAFTNDEINYLYHSDQSYNFVRVYLEESLLIEMSKIFSGEANIRDQKELFNKLKEETPAKITFDDLIERHQFQVLMSGYRGGI